MQEKTILDHEPVVKNRIPLLRKIALVIEISLWLFIIIAYEQPWRHDVQFILQKTLGPSNASLVGLLLAMFFYLLFPILVFRSENWKQHLLSHFCGLAISTWILSIFFIIEAWPWANQMAIAAAAACLGFGIMAIVMLIRNFKTQAKTFYWNIILRMSFPILLTATALYKYYHSELSF